MKSKTSSDRMLLDNGLKVEQAISIIEHRIVRAVTVVKPYVSRFLLVFAIYCLAMLAIWRSGFSYMDDLGRSISGYTWSHEFNRYSSSIISILFGTNMSLVDLSPWTQIFSMFMLAIATVLLALSFQKTIGVAYGKTKKLTLLPYVLASFLVISPFAMGCFIYKFDSLCMAFAIVMAIIPVAMWHKINIKSFKSMLVYCLIVAVTTILTLTSYQAVSGILPVLILGIILCEYYTNKKFSKKDAAIKIGISIVGYIVACAFFAFILPKPNGYRDVSMVQFSKLIPHLLSTCVEIYRRVIEGANGEWKVLGSVSIIVSTGIICACTRGKIISKLAKGLMFIVFIAVAIPLSYGVYLVLKDAMPVSQFDTARYFIGQNAVIATAFIVAAVVLTQKVSGVKAWLVMSPVILLLYSFSLFPIALGNGLSDQFEFASSRIDNLLSLLNNVDVSADTKVQISGTIGPSPVMQHVMQQYPVTNYIIGETQYGLGAGYWGEYRLKNYYKLNYISTGGIDCVSFSDSVDNQFYDIRYSQDKNEICVGIK